MRVGPLDHLAVHFQHQAQDVPWAAGCCGPKFIVIGLICISAMTGPYPSLVAFSSPGIWPCMPSHGLRKSKSRNSCTSDTGSLTTRQRVSS